MRVDLNADLTEVGAFVGTVEGLTASVSTGLYINRVVEDAHAYLARRFNEQTHLIARSGNVLGHMYEDGYRGVPQMQLWRNICMGRGRRRRGSFSFMPAKLPTQLPDVPPSATGKTLKKQHVFKMKAYVMEYGLPVNIRPKKGKALFIYLGENASTRAGAEDSGFVFAPHAYIKHAGGRNIGTFRAHFEGWWRDQAPLIFAEQVVPRYERDVDNIVSAGGRAAKKSRRGAVGLKSFEIGYDAGFAAAKASAQAEAELKLRTEYSNAE